MSPWFVLLLVLVAALGAIPVAEGQHCVTKIAVYGRVGLAPSPPPPYMSLNQGICPRVDPAVDHTLPPQTEQIFVRINGDFGPSKPTLRLDLEGLGFVGSTFTLQRTPNAMGGSTYQLGEWLNVPSPASGATITATAYYPDGPMSSTFVTSVNVGLPEPPVDPEDPQPPEVPGLPSEG